MDRPRFSRREVAFMIGVPLAWAILLLFHPRGEGEDFYPIIRDDVTAWEIVHLGTLIFVPLMVGVVLLLLRGTEGTSAMVSRMALAVFAVVYTAWEVLIGIGTGILVDEVNQLAEAERATGAILVEEFTDSSLIMALENIGVVGWFVALFAAGVALVRHAGASWLVPALLVLSAVPTAWHVFPFGQVGLALFIAAVLVFVRSQSASLASAAA
jgi:hypothetical protein